MRLTNTDYKDRVGEAFDDLVFLANINPNDVCKFPVKNLREQELKLGQLEDIEDEYNVNLVDIKFFPLLCTILKQGGIYVKIKGYICFTDNLEYITYKKAKYGKTWALTKEELE